MDATLQMAADKETRVSHAVRASHDMATRRLRAAPALDPSSHSDTIE